MLRWVVPSASSPRSVGVEEELLLFAGARPAPVGEELAEDPDAPVEHELKLEQAELASDPAVELAELAEDLRRRRREVMASAADRGVTVAGLATSPTGTRPTPTPDDRYERMLARFGLIADDQLTCGAHVHVSVASREEGVAVIDGVRPWLAVLLALSANSPYWGGTDTGYTSYRCLAWGRWPTAGPTARFGSLADYDRTVATLIDSGAALDTGMIYFDVRLSENYPTVEFRVADVGQEVEDSVLLAALCRAAADTVLHDGMPEVEVAVLRAAAWRAARYGTSGELLDVRAGRLRPAADVVDRLLDELTPALRRTGDEQQARELVDRLWRRGTGAELQRADRSRHDRAVDVIRGAAARL
jgi:glutamate---cysteine ligase / carboxylate-amine ligase